MSFELVVVGGGNMGAALLGGLLESGAIEPSKIAVVEKFEPRRGDLTTMFPGVHIAETVPTCNAAVLAVKPPDIPGVAAEAANAGAVRVLSIAAGVTIETLQTAVGEDRAVLRAMPNTPALIGQGVTALAGAPGTTTGDLEWAEQILDALGMVVRVPESQLDAVTGLTGSGPAYVFLVAEALIDAGLAVGLSRSDVEPMVAQLLVGSSALLAERGDPKGLRTMVTSPGGTTAEGIRVLEERSVRSGFVDAVRAATERSRELGSR